MTPPHTQWEETFTQAWTEQSFYKAMQIFRDALHAEYQRGRKEEREAIKDALPKEIPKPAVPTNGNIIFADGWNAYRNEVVKGLK